MKRRAAKLNIALALIALAVSLIWVSRVRAAREALEYAPTAELHVVVPEDTEIDALIENGISSSALAGDSISALVPEPVTTAGEPAIPAGAHLLGYLTKISVLRRKAHIEVNFTTLVTNGRSFAIRTHPVSTVARVRSDADILSSALKTMIGAGLGTALGAAAGTPRVTNRMLFEGAKDSLPIPPMIPVIVVLENELSL